MNRCEGYGFPNDSYNLFQSSTEKEKSAIITEISAKSLLGYEAPRSPILTLYSSENPTSEQNRVFYQISTSKENPVKEVQIYGYNDVTLTLNDNQKIVVSRHFIKCKKLDAADLAIYLRQTYLVVSKLSDDSYQVNINPKGLVGGSPTKREIHTAVIKQDINLLRSVLAKKVPSRYPVDVVDDEGVTPLQYACLNGNVEMVNMLLAKGANIDKPLEASTGNQPIHMACFNGHLEVVKIILARKGSSVLGVRNKDGMTPLSFAASWGRLDVVTFLLSQKVEVDVLDNDCHTALAYASKGELKAIVNILLQNGADPDKILPSAYENLSNDIKHILGGFKRQNYTTSSSSSSNTTTNTRTNSNSAMNAMGAAFGKELADDVFKLALGNSSQQFPF